MTRRYSPEQRIEAVRLAARVGAAEAGRRLDIDGATVRQWVKRESDQATAVVRSVRPSADLSPGASWAERQPVIADALAEIADDIVNVLGEAIAEGRARDAQRWMTTLAIAIDKSRLLANQPQHLSATETRTVSLSVKVDEETARAEVEKLRVELGMGAPEVIEVTGHDD